MSNQASQSPTTSRFHSTFQSASYSYSSASVNGSTISQSEATYSDPSGTKVYRKVQNPGEAPREERLEYDRSGRQLQDAAAGAGAGAIEGRVEDVTEEEEEEREEEQRERDGQYEVKMENEYAKREGGA